ncbi:xanthine dehydrogenase family protein molybdopterin-binding subunit [Thalassospira sp.]|uniref:xanthine dehydrogenase family protein molybdopterin-binding subunit n=1 Tax=Thalassospira sp. TaxID=1912094 RepID=UPI000C64A477|nr:xanthine dehydrogenase family protein molybdopterin-binding subunit [Thalassospira sp.]MBC07284.1 isoquinoline 1-oxidoreductase [Thalassospira sp.]
MKNLKLSPSQQDQFPTGEPVNISRRRFLLGAAGATTGALVLGFGLPVGKARAQSGGEVTPGTRVPAFLEIRPDNTVRLQSPFVEGGQGVFTAMAQIVGEELDADPKSFVVESAPAGPDYLVINNQMRITGGSMSVRTSYDTMRKLGASARNMLLQAAAIRFDVPLAQLTTEPGYVVNSSTGQKVPFGDLAEDALDLPVPDSEGIKLRDPSTFRWIGKPVDRLDIHDKATGKAIFSIDCAVEGMVHAAVQHAPRLGLGVGNILNETDVSAMKGVMSIHRLPGAVAVVAERWWNAKVAAEALQVEWVKRDEDGSNIRHMPDDFSTVAFSDHLANQTGNGKAGEEEGDVGSAISNAATTVEATYRSQFVHHGQLEPPSALARFNDDGTLDVWMPNQAPEQFQSQIAGMTGLEASQINVHSPMLGGFFGRHFLYPEANPYPQAVQLAKEVGRPVKLIWSREEEFLRDPLRPMAVVKFRGGLDADGMPVGLEAISATEGPTEGIYGHNPDSIDPLALEGLTGKKYAIANRRIAQIYVKTPAMLAYWRSVGHSMNDFFYETFFDELADQGGHDPYELRMQLLQSDERLSNLLRAVGDLSGGWKRGPFTAEDGSQRARGVGMASPFGSESAAIAEVSMQNGDVVVHDVWEAIDPGSIVNPAIIEAQVKSAVALGVSQILMEEAIYENGEPTARNYDLYPILRPDQMPNVHVRIVESGAKMGGIGEPGLPPVLPAIANAVSTLTGQRVRSMPLSNLRFES